MENIQNQKTSHGEQVSPPLTNQKQIFQRHNARIMVWCALGAIAVWIAEFIYFFQNNAQDKLGISLVRSFGNAGAMLISVVLFLSAVFKWFPKTARHWRLRRYLGVSGFVMVCLHVASVLHFYVTYDVAILYYSFNPFQNPIIFGTIAFCVLFVMAVTSSDLMMQKVKPKRWKVIHRFVYIAYASIIFHFITTNPSVLKNPTGYILLSVSFVAVFGMVFWFIKTAARTKFHSLGTFIGFFIILTTAVVGYIVYLSYFRT